MRARTLPVVLGCTVLGVLLGLLAAASRATQSASLKPLTAGRPGVAAAAGLGAQPPRWAYAYYVTSEAVRPSCERLHAQTVQLGLCPQPRRTTHCAAPLLQYLCAALVGAHRLRDKLHATPLADIVVMHSSSLGRPGGAVHSGRAASFAWQRWPLVDRWHQEGHGSGIRSARGPGALRCRVR